MILIVEDEPDIAELIAFNLQRKGYKTAIASDGITGLEMAFKLCPSLILLDLMLPEKNGVGVIKELQRDSRTNRTPVIMLTAKAQVEDKIAGLELGADDYITKPFSPKELVLRVQALLKRSNEPASATVLEVGPIRLDKGSLKCHIDGEYIDLTSTEFKLLLYFAERPNMVADRNELLKKIWGYHEDVQSRTLDTHLKRLRHKLGENADLLDTVRGIGYRLVVPTT